jgi:hypothetical protein
MALQKSTLLAALVLSLACGFATTAGAMTMSSSVPILMIDGVGDADTTVDISVKVVSSGYDFGYYDGTDFVLILADSSSFTTTSFAGGDIVDFAIMDTSTSEIYKLSDGDAALEFEDTSMISASLSQYPIVSSDYYSRVEIKWAIGANDIVFSLRDIYDGFAPSMPAPEPSAALVFGLGFVLFERIVRRNTRR